MIRRTVVLALVACQAGAPVATSRDSGSPGGDGIDGASVDAPLLPSCSCPLGDGTYCAAAAASYAAGHACSIAVLDGHAGDVLRCANRAWTVDAACANGCYTAPDGKPDGCKPDARSWHLPWTCGIAFPTTQGNHGDICDSNGGDHTGVQDFAWDFGLPRHTPVRATRSGTVTVAANVTGPGQACYDGCTQTFGTPEFWSCCNACLDVSNHVNIAHGDGTVSTYWHLDMSTVHVGDAVSIGDVLGYSGTSGCSSGSHLHFMVMGNCPTGYCQSVPIVFDEAGAPACGDSVTSRNGCVR